MRFLYLGGGSGVPNYVEQAVLLYQRAIYEVSHVNWMYYLGLFVTWVGTKLSWTLTEIFKCSNDMSTMAHTCVLCILQYFGLLKVTTACTWFWAVRTHVRTCHLRGSTRLFNGHYGVADFSGSSGIVRDLQGRVLLSDRAIYWGAHVSWMFHLGVFHFSKTKVQFVQSRECFSQFYSLSPNIRYLAVHMSGVLGNETGDFS